MITKASGIQVNDPGSSNSISSQKQQGSNVFDRNLPTRDSSEVGSIVNSIDNEFMVSLNLDNLAERAANGSVAGVLSADYRKSIVRNAVKLRDQFVNETGNSDGGTNSNPFGRFFGNDGAPWCGYYVDRVMQYAGVNAPRMYNVIDGANTAKARGQWKDSRHTPDEGDIVVLDFQKKGTIQGADHTGIVVGLVRNAQGKVTHVKTIEGNTSPGASGSQDDGDGIFFRTRPIDQVVGYVIPKKR